MCNSCKQHIYAIFNWFLQSLEKYFKVTHFTYRVCWEQQVLHVWIVSADRISCSRNDWKYVFSMDFVHLFHAADLFLYSMKTSENVFFFFLIFSGTVTKLLNLSKEIWSQRSGEIHFHAPLQLRFLAALEVVHITPCRDTRKCISTNFFCDRMLL